MDVLIQAVKQRPCLWDPNDKDYRTPDEKEACWQDIVGMKILKLRDVDEAKAEWKKLRDCHRDSLKRVISKYGSNAVNTWKYAKEMEFLLPHMKSRRKSNRLNIEVSSEYLDMPDDEEYSEIQVNDNVNNETLSEEAVFAKKRKIDTETDIFAEVDFSYQREEKDGLESTCNNKEKHAIDLFMESMAVTIKGMPSWMQTKVKRKILTVVCDAEDELLENPVGSANGISDERI